MLVIYQRRCNPLQANVWKTGKWAWVAQYRFWIGRPLSNLIAKTTTTENGGFLLFVRKTPNSTAGRSAKQWLKLTKGDFSAKFKVRGCPISFIQLLMGPDWLIGEKESSIDRQLTSQCHLPSTWNESFLVTKYECFALVSMCYKSELIPSETRWQSEKPNLLKGKGQL